MADECAACAARQQTIIMLSDQVDWLRNQLNPNVPLLPPADAVEHFRPIEGPNKLWTTEGEEDLEAMLEAKSISAAQYEEALAAEQTQNTHIQLVKD